MAYAKSAAMYVSIAEERQPAKRRQSVRFAVSDMARWIQTIIPVSYTHLDVYKRQCIQKQNWSGSQREKIIPDENI